MGVGMDLGGMASMTPVAETTLEEASDSKPPPSEGVSSPGLKWARCPAANDLLAPRTERDLQGEYDSGQCGCVAA